MASMEIWNRLSALESAVMSLQDELKYEDKTIDQLTAALATLARLSANGPLTGIEETDTQITLLLNEIVMLRQDFEDYRASRKIVKGY